MLIAKLPGGRACEFFFIRNTLPKTHNTHRIGNKIQL